MEFPYNYFISKIEFINFCSFNIQISTKNVQTKINKEQSKCTLECLIVRDGE